MSSSDLPNLSLLSAIERLKAATAKLPASTPEGSIDGVVWQNFNVSPHSAKGAIFEKIDQACARCFSRLPNSSTDPINNIVRGPYGMDVVIRFFEECAQSSKLDSSASHLTELKVGQLTDLVYNRINSLPKDPPSISAKKQRRTSNSRRRKFTRLARVTEAKGDESRSSSDSEFSPQPVPTDSELDEDSSNSDIGKVQTSIEIEHSELPQRPSKQQKTLSSIEGVGDIQGDESHVNLPTQLTVRAGKRRGRDPIVRLWAFAHHENAVKGSYPGTNKPAWAFKCKYCPSTHHFLRTRDDVSEENISASNLAGHLKLCKNLPAQYKLEAFRSHTNRRTETLTPAQESLGKMFQSNKPRMTPATITPSVFRSTLIQGIVRDNYPLTFGEGEGMRQVFGLVSPELSLPVHSTMRKDLAKLYKVLSARVRQVLNAQKSRFAITSDAWTSKSFVYSLGGVVVTFIDKSWNTQEFVLDIVHLDADHTGAGMGRRIFGSLDHMNAARNIIASVTHNASNNRTMNAELSAQLTKKYGYQLNADLMSITCLCHALHLVCSAILTNLKVMDPMDDDSSEQYAIVKSFKEGEIFEESSDVLEEEEQLQGEEQDLDTHVDSAEVSEDEMEDAETGNNRADFTGLGSQPSQNSANDNLNCVQKVHCIAVDITSSAARRKRMRMITRALGLERRAIIKGVKVGWNSILAEIRRAILLKSAINQYVATLDEGKTGAALRRARKLKKKWTITDEEWDALEELVKILEPFEAATRGYSKRGRTVLHSVLPTYAVLRQMLIDSRVRLSVSSVGSDIIDTLIEALKAGEKKLQKYFDLAIESDFTLLASILHPGMRLVYFQDTQRWGALGESLVKRGQALLEYLYDLYKQETSSEQAEYQPTPRPRPSSSTSGWIDGLLQLSNETKDSAFLEEVQNYLNGKYRYKGGDISIWWRENEPNLPVLARIARDILAIPATSVSVERLFSRCKLVMSDYRNMSVDTARQIITCQQWLEAGLGVDLPDFVSND
ncbi:Zinc finger BED domain-containing protein 4 [Homo sapiens] [Rhizoctonia solani]|uniref:Zinc finger BED domain-containing protein 4 [Homo sapiens] n=1 Tax=Rhizoctonia solani TaxID=456999 RepID=A0A0K6G3I3_9AGAM|nr:Zinc finger BED domain-containing protein 4 [Homo sapiens] [Rhizoctonia solani]